MNADFRSFANELKNEIIIERAKLALKALTWLLAAFVISAFADIWVLEYIYKPLADKHGVPWNAFQTKLSLPSKTITVLVWHPGFWILTAALVLMASVAARRKMAFVVGIVWFLAGVEDMFYYFMQLKPIPAELPWLDDNSLLMGLAKIQGLDHVSASTVLTASIVAILAGSAVLFLTSGKRRIA